MDFTLRFMIFSFIASFTQSVKVPIPDGPTNRYFQVGRSCSGKMVYCREGSRGPCGENQLLAEEVDLDRLSFRFECRLLDNADCTTQFDATAIYSDARDVCVWSHEDHPCYGYPANYRLYPEDGGCYTSYISHSPQCKKFQRFYAVNGTVGRCDCIVVLDSSTSYLYWPQTDECYEINSQGPCSAGEWLTLDSSGNSRCEITSCPADGLHVYYSDGQQEPACYRLQQRGPCPDGQHLYRVQVFPEKYECVDYPPIVGVPNVAIAKPRIDGCVPGTKLWVNGGCRKHYP